MEKDWEEKRTHFPSIIRVGRDGVGLSRLLSFHRDFSNPLPFDMYPSYTLLSSHRLTQVSIRNVPITEGQNHKYPLFFFSVILDFGFTRRETWGGI